jgi:ubiquinone biosynthesis protein
MLEALGGSFIKLGQVLSLQPDLVPRDYCDELFDLLDRVPPFDYEDVERIFEEDLGKAPTDLFDRFEVRPFASASIGQVHRAQLDGRQFAIKVRRPTALRDFGGDIRLMRVATELITRLRIRKLYAFRVPINEFIAWTTDELDYRTEARYMTEASVNSTENSVARVPDTIGEFSTARILTTEYLEATTMLEYLRSLDRNDPAVGYRLSQSGFEPAQFAENIITNFLGDVFRYGLFHADLHPANLLILPDNVVGYVDFGITGIISKYGREQVLELIQALARQDVDDLYDGVVAISEITPTSDLERFREGLQNLADDWFELEHGVSKLAVSYTVIMLDLLRLSRACSLLPHEEAVRYMRSVITADGLIGRFAPEYDVSAGLERLSKKQRERQALGDLLSADRMIENWIAGSRLLRDGPSRLDALLDRLERRSREQYEKEGGRTISGLKQVAATTARLALLVVALSLLLVLGNEAPELGLNVFSAELVLLTGGGTLLTWTVLKWLDTPR